MARDAVRYFTTDSPQLAYKLRAKLAKRHDELLGMLVTAPASEFADYTRRVGHLSGILEAIQICEELEKDDR